MALSDQDFNGFMKVHLTFGLMTFLIFFYEIASFNEYFQTLYT